MKPAPTFYLSHLTKINIYTNILSSFYYNYKNPIREVEMNYKQHTFAYQERKVSLIERAKKASKKAMTYRPFNVGCAVLAYSETEQKYKIFVGANLKPAESAVKVCAERVAIMNAVTADYNFIVAIAVYGPPQKDAASGVESPTLHPCDVCRNTLRDLIVNEKILERVVDFDTILLTINSIDDQREEMDMKELFHIHSTSLEVHGLISVDEEKEEYGYLIAPPTEPATLHQWLLRYGYGKF